MNYRKPEQAPSSGGSEFIAVITRCKDSPKDHWYCFSRHRPTYRGMLHGLIFLATPVWATMLLWHCRSFAACLSALLSLIAKSFVFGASSVYHCGRWKYPQEQLASKIDLAAISGMIAFSIAPVYALLLETGALILLASTVFAFISAGLVLAGASKRLRTCTYLVQGALSCLPLGHVQLSGIEICGLVIAGVAYVIGAAIYVSEFPSPSHEHFGYHEVWHLLVVVAASGTYMCNMSVIQRISLASA